MAQDDQNAAPQTSPENAVRAPAAAQPQQSPAAAPAVVAETPVKPPVAQIAPAAAPAPVAAPKAATPPIAAAKIEAPQPAPIAAEPAAKPARKTTITPGSKTPQKRAGATLQKTAIKTTQMIAPKTEPSGQTKDNKTMATQEKIKNDVSAVVADVQEFAKTAYAKGSEVTGNLGGFVKGNAEAVVASGKTLGEGFKDLGAGSLADSRKVIATVADDLKAFASLKSPAELFELQGKIAGRNFEAALGYATKSSETLRDLATKAFAPISARVQANLEALRKAA